MSKTNAFKSLVILVIFAALASAGVAFAGAFLRSGKLAKGEVETKSHQAADVIQVGKQSPREQAVYSPPRIHDSWFIVFAPDGKSYAVDVKDAPGNFLTLCGTATGLIKIIEGSFFACGPDGKSFVAGFDKDGLALYDAQTGRIIRQLPGISKAVFCAPGLIAAPARTAHNETAMVLEKASGKLLWRLEDCYWFSGELVVSADGKLAGGSVSITKNDRGLPCILYLWDLATGKRLKNVAFPLGSLGGWFAFSADSKYALVESMGVGNTGKDANYQNDMGEWGFTYSANLYELSTGKDLGRFGEVAYHQGFPKAVFRSPLDFLRGASAFRVCVSPAGRHIVVAKPRRFLPKWLTEEKIGIWDSAAKQEIAVFGGFAFAGTPVLFAGDHLLAAPRATVPESSAYKVVLWDVRENVDRALLTKPAASGKVLEALFEDLGSADEALALDAQCILSALPKEALAVFKVRLKKPSVLTKGQIAELVKMLESDSFATREKAKVALIGISEDTIGVLRDFSKSSDLTLEARQRLGLIIAAGIGKETMQVLRAIDILETWATPEAGQFLASLAGGSPEAWLSREAQAAYNRMSLKK